MFQRQVFKKLCFCFKKIFVRKYECKNLTGQRSALALEAGQKVWRLGTPAVTTKMSLFSDRIGPRSILTLSGPRFLLSKSRSCPRTTRRSCRACTAPTTSTRSSAPTAGSTRLSTRPASTPSRRTAPSSSPC